MNYKIINSTFFLFSFVSLNSISIDKALSVNAPTVGKYDSASYDFCSVTTSCHITKISQTSNPNQDRFPQSLPEIDLQNDETFPVLSPSEIDVSSDDSDETSKIEVNSIEVIGSTIYTSEDWSTFTEPLEGRKVTVAELTAAADSITNLYRRDGYLTSRAVLLQQEVVDGVIQIQVIEGSLEDIKIIGNRNVRPNYINSRIGLDVEIPLNISKLETQLQLLRQNSLFDEFDATLQPGQNLGESVLAIQIDESKSFSGFASFDNYSPVALGSERLGVGASYRNLTGYGDKFSASYYMSTTGGSDIVDLSYQLPVNPMEGTLQLRTTFDWTEVTEEPFDELDIKGDSEFYEISFRQPLIRKPTAEFALSAAFSFDNGQTFTFDDIPTPFGIGPDEDGISRTSVFKFGQDYTRRDSSGIWSLRSLFNFGTGLFNATSNTGKIPDSAFFSWDGQLQRVQRLNSKHTLIIQGNAQLTPDPLLSSEQFVVGGFHSVRGYRESKRNGDNGIRFSIEDRITLARNQRNRTNLQLIPFIDMGYVWNDEDNPNNLPSRTFLASIGAGVIYEPLENLNLRLDYGLPLVDLDDGGDNIQDDGFHFGMSYQF